MLPVILSPIHTSAPARSWLRELVFRPSDYLRVVVAAATDDGGERQFTCDFDAAYLRGFLRLDEGDLMTIWQSPHYVPNAALLYEVVQGSLYEGFSERPGVLSVSMSFGRLDDLGEYLIATDDDCVVVLSARPPTVEEPPPTA